MGGGFGRLGISSLLFADDVTLLTSLRHDLQLALGWFGTECEVAGMIAGTSKYGRMLSCVLQVGDGLLSQMEEFWYLMVLRKGRVELESHR